MIEELKVIFLYNGNTIIIQCRREEKMKDIANRFKTKIGLNSNNLIFLCNGTILNLEHTFNEEIRDDIKSKNEMTVVVKDNTNSFDNEADNKTIYSKTVICPICKEKCRISIVNYKIILFECKNGHKTNNILLEEFSNKQQINEYLITCDDCNNENKGSSYKNKFYKCLTCKKQLGELCKEKHIKKEHIILEYDKKNYICEIHNDYFWSYCQDCKLNLCMNCDSEHNDHNTIEYKIILPNREKINNELIELKKNIDNIKQFIKEINEKFEIITKNMDIFYQINYDILNNNNNLQNKNFQLLKNINEISHNIEMSNIDKIVNEKNISNKISELLKAYDKMVNKEENHDIIQKEEIDNKIREKKKEKEMVKTDFKRLKTVNVYPKTEHKTKQSESKVHETNINEKPKNSTNKKNNDLQKSKARRQSTKEIATNIKIKDDEKLGPNQIILKYEKGDIKDKKIKIFGEKFVSNNSSKCSIIFEGKTLELIETLDLPSTYKNKKIIELKLIANDLTDMSYMFHDCILLTSLSNNSTLDTSNVTNMSYIFYNCNRLNEISCISKWVTSNVTDISYMFYSCSSLKNLPNISIWNTDKVTTLESLFEYCTSLSSLPDISKWNISNVTTLNSLFAYCQSLISLPDISKWNTSNVTHMNYTFKSCEKLKCIPNISSWDISKVEFKYNMFGGCTNLKNIPSKFQ